MWDVWGFDVTVHFFAFDHSEEIFYQFCGRTYDNMWKAIETKVTSLTFSPEQSNPGKKTKSQFRPNIQLYLKSAELFPGTISA